MRFSDNYLVAQHFVLAGIIVLCLWPILWLASIALMRRKFGLQVGSAERKRYRSLLALGFAAGLLVIVWSVAMNANGYIQQFLYLRFSEDLARELVQRPWEFGFVILQLISRGLLCVFVVVMGTTLYRTWLHGGPPQANPQAVPADLRTALNPWNVLGIFSIALCAHIGYGWPFFAVAFVALAAVMAYPLLMTPAKSGGVAPTAPTDLSPERQRVLRMLDEGKITADDASELLSALSATLPPEPQVEPWTPAHQRMIAGAALILIGFFLPWFAINPGRELQRLAPKMWPAQEQMRQQLHLPQAPPVRPAHVAYAIPTIQVSGGDIANGLGWLVLALGLGAAAAPYILTGMRRDVRERGVMVAIAAGLILVLYLLTRGWENLSYGLPFVGIGYLLEAAAIYFEHRQRHPGGSPLQSPTTIRPDGTRPTAIHGSS